MKKKLLLLLLFISSCGTPSYFCSRSYMFETFNEVTTFYDTFKNKNDEFFVIPNENIVLFDLNYKFIDEYGNAEIFDNNIYDAKFNLFRFEIECKDLFKGSLVPFLDKTNVDLKQVTSVYVKEASIYKIYSNNILIANIEVFDFLSSDIIDSLELMFKAGIY